MQPFSDSDRSDSQLDMPLHSVFGVCIVYWEIFGKPSAYSREFFFLFFFFGGESVILITSIGFCDI